MACQYGWDGSASTGLHGLTLAPGLVGDIVARVGLVRLHLAVAPAVHHAAVVQVPGGRRQDHHSRVHGPDHIERAVAEIIIRAGAPVPNPLERIAVVVLEHDERPVRGQPRSRGDRHGPAVELQPRALALFVTVTANLLEAVATKYRVFVGI